MNETYKQVLDILYQAKKLGWKRLPSGTERIGKTSYFGPLAYLHTTFAPLQDWELQQLEYNLGKELPGEYKEFLKLTNGICLFADGLSLKGVRRVYRSVADEESMTQPSDIIGSNTYSKPFFAKDSYVFIGWYSYGNGFYLYIDKDTDKVHLCSRRTAFSLYEWPSFWDMLLSETKRLSKFYGEDGRMKDYYVQFLPISSWRHPLLVQTKKFGDQMKSNDQWQEDYASGKIKPDDPQN